MYKLHPWGQVLYLLGCDTQAGSLTELLISHSIILLGKFCPHDVDKAVTGDPMGGHAAIVIPPLWEKVSCGLRQSYADKMLVTQAFKALKE